MFSFFVLNFPSRGCIICSCQKVSFVFHLNFIFSGYGPSCAATKKCGGACFRVFTQRQNICYWTHSRLLSRFISILCFLLFNYVQNSLISYYVLNESFLVWLFFLELVPLGKSKPKHLLFLVNFVTFILSIHVSGRASNQFDFIDFQQKNSPYCGLHTW